MRCPDCKIELEIFVKGNHEIIVCPQCFSTLLPSLVSVRALKYFCTQEILSILLDRIADNSLVYNKSLLGPHAEFACPKCKSYMRQYDLDKKIRFLVNQCISCHATWLNIMQAPLVAIAFREKTADDENFKATIETLYKTLSAKRGTKPRSLDEIVAPFIVFSGILPAIPRGDNVLTKKPPIATRTILIACVAIFLSDMLFRFSELLSLSAQGTIREFQWYRLITYSFLHADIFHLAGNMIFLWAFARSVEDELGWEKFTALYAISAVFSGILFLATPSGKNLPCVGASGAVSGVIGAHLILFPKAKIIFNVCSLSKKTRTAISSFYYIAFWIGMNIWFGIVQLTKDSSRIAFWGHIGGFMAGVVFIEVYKNLRRQ